jgi:hypothetical protein
LTGADYDYQTDESYTYDDNGNRVTANGDTYSSGDDKQLLSDGTYTYTNDAEGNRVAKFIDANSNGELDTGDTIIAPPLTAARANARRLLPTIRRQFG